MLVSKRNVPWPNCGPEHHTAAPHSPRQFLANSCSAPRIRVTVYTISYALLLHHTIRHVGDAYLTQGAKQQSLAGILWVASSAARALITTSSKRGPPAKRNGIFLCGHRVVSEVSATNCSHEGSCCPAGGCSPLSMECSTWA